MTQMTDLQLVVNYQQTKKEDYLNTLIKRYDGYLHNQTFRIYRNQKAFDNEHGFEDIRQELNICSIIAVHGIKVEKIKDKNKFSFYTPLRYRIMNFENTHKKQIVHQELEEEDAINNTPKERYLRIAEIMERFENKLSKEEKKVWELFLSGLRKNKIAIKMKISLGTLTNIINKLKEKFKDFIDNDLFEEKE